MERKQVCDSQMLAQLVADGGLRVFLHPLFRVSYKGRGQYLTRKKLEVIKPLA